MKKKTGQRRGEEFTNWKKRGKMGYDKKKSISTVKDTSR